MKLISLNTWSGRAGEEKLLDFFQRYNDVDIFCLQEVQDGGDPALWTKIAGRHLPKASITLLDDIKKTLQKHSAYFRLQFRDCLGVATFIRKDLEVTEEGETYVYQEKGYVSETELADHARNLQYVAFEALKGLRTVTNLHTLWTKDKGDNAERLLQSDKILNFVGRFKNPVIMCGDFNLRPDTESIKKLEKAGFRNLIKEYGITSTRNSYYKYPEKFADYIFVNDGIKVNDFKVLPDEVSDHAPLFLDFD